MPPRCGGPAAEAYRRVAVDACIQGSRGHALTSLCFMEATAALRRAIYADRNGHLLLRGRTLVRARSAVQALRAGVERNHPLGPALLTIYGACDAVITRCLTSFDADAVARTITDLDDILSALDTAARSDRIDGQ